MGTAYGYIRTAVYEHGPTSQAQKRKIDKVYKDKCPSIPWGTFFEDLNEASLRVPLAKRKAGRQLLRQLRPGDVLLVARLYRLFGSVIDANRHIKDWTRRGITFDILDCPGGLDTSNPIVAA